MIDPLHLRHRLVPLLAWNMELLQLLAGNVERDARECCGHKPCWFRLRRIGPALEKKGIISLELVSRTRPRVRT